MLPPHFVPCQQDAISVRFFACTIGVRAYPTAPTCKISMRRCAALRRPTCFKLLCTCKSHECGESASACCCTVFCNSAKVESLRALHQSTNVQRRSAWHTAPATLVPRPAPVDSLHLWTSGGVCVRLRVCNSACDGRIAAPFYMPMQWNTRGSDRSVSASACRMRSRSRSSRVAGSMSDRFVQSTQIAAWLQT